MDFNNIQSLNADRLTSLNAVVHLRLQRYADLEQGQPHLQVRHGHPDIWKRSRRLASTAPTITAPTSSTRSGSSGVFTGVDFADFLLGIPNQTFYDVVKQDNDGISNHYHFFGQDEWRLSPQLTLSYGVRYELHPGYYDKYGDIGNFDPSVALAGRVIYPQGKQDSAGAGLSGQRQCLRCRRCEQHQFRDCEWRALHAGGRQQHGRLSRRA